jgi:anaphase-promoting complex subunit 5
LLLYITDLSTKAKRLGEAAPWLVFAEMDYRELEMYRPLQDVQYLLSIVYHNLDMRPERQEAAQRHADRERQQQELEMETVHEDILKVFEVIASVGNALAAR